MKRVNLNNVNDLPIVGTLIQWVQSSPSEQNGQGITIGDIRARVKIIDKLEKAKIENVEFVDLEDTELDAFKRVINHARFPIADKFIISLADRIFEAKEAKEA